MAMTVQKFDALLLCGHCKTAKICNLKNDYKEIVKRFFVSCAEYEKNPPNDYFTTPNCVFYLPQGGVK